MVNWDLVVQKVNKMLSPRTLSLGHKCIKERRWLVSISDWFRTLMGVRIWSKWSPVVSQPGDSRAQ